VTRRGQVKNKTPTRGVGVLFSSFEWGIGDDGLEKREKGKSGLAHAPSEKGRVPVWEKRM